MNIKLFKNYNKTELLKIIDVLSKQLKAYDKLFDKEIDRNISEILKERGNNDRNKI